MDNVIPDFGMNGDSDYSYMGGGQTIPPADVDDALQYTPLSSVVPFAPNMVPMPVLVMGETSSYQSEAEQQNSRHNLNVLNREAEREPTSKVVRKCLIDITTQLGPSINTEFRFKSLGGLDGVDDSTGPNERPGDFIRNPIIGKFGEMILANTKVPARYALRGPHPLKVPPTPVTAPTAGPGAAPSLVSSHSPQTPVRPTSQTHSYSPGNVSVQIPKPTTSQIQIQIPSRASNHAPKPTPTPQTSRPSSVSLTPVPQTNGYHHTIQVQIPTTSRSAQQAQRPRTNGVGYPSMSPTPSSGSHLSHASQGSQIFSAVVIKSPPHIDRTQYTKHERLDQRLKQSKPIGSTSSNRKRKRLHSDELDDEPLVSGVDQRAKAETLLRNLQYSLDSVFEAEDMLQPDTSGRIANRSDTSKYWLSGTQDSDRPCLSTAYLTKLESQIKSVISVRRYGKITVDDVTRLQKICDNSLKIADTDDIVPPNGAESSMEDWLGKVGLIDNGLKAARTVLRTMLGGREEKQIYSEDTLKSVLNLTKNFVHGTVNPMIEMRSSSDKEKFKAAIAQKKILGGLLHEVTTVMSLLADLITHEEVAEDAITTVQFIGFAVVFIENAKDEKESVFGYQRVEMFRLAAMDLLTKVFARYSNQRSFMFDEILTRLEKLSINRASARQFKLVEGSKNIQLVSALIMKLIQTCGMYQGEKRKRQTITEDNEEEDGNRATEDDDAAEDPERNPNGTIRRLNNLCKPLLDGAQTSAAYVVAFLVGRAMKSTKTGDEPYRHLMDIFTEDFLAVLGSPEWPAAEILLRNILVTMVNIVDGEKGEKHPAGAKIMALDLLGLMGSEICDLNVHLRDGHRARDSIGHGLESKISDITARYLQHGSSGGGDGPGTSLEEALVEWEGPYRILFEYLFEQSKQDHNLRSAYGYYFSQWSSRVCALYEKLTVNDDEEELDEDLASDLAIIASKHRRMLLHKEWDDDDFDVRDLSSTNIRQAYALTVLNMPFCTMFAHILSRLLRSIDDNQAQTRSKGIKAITHLISKDPGILDRTSVISFITKKASDASPMVRDSAVDLLSKCINLKPEIEDNICKVIIERCSDTGVQVRKRAMKILKDVYLRSKTDSLKLAIAEALVQRIKDVDSGVAELARKSFEEIWIAPFYNHVEEEDADREISPEVKLLANEGVGVIIKVIRKEGMLSTLHDVIKSLLQQDNNKNSGKNFVVCKTMVSSMFADLPERQSDDGDRNDRENTMQALTVFARANANLFTSDQLKMLQPYIENLTSDDLQLFRSVIIIYRCALPGLSTRDKDFLLGIQQSLLRNLTRLPSPELREVVSCLWTIGCILKDLGRSIRVTVSCLKNILNVKGKTIAAETAKKISRTMYILGLFGHYCNFENDKEIFRKDFPEWKGDTVSGLIVDTIIPFCAVDIEPSVRKAAIESLGLVCQNHAQHFIRPEVLRIYEKIFAENDKELISFVLQGIKGFLNIEESRSQNNDGASAESKSNGVGPEAGRLADVVYQGTHDGVATGLSQSFLKDIVKVATSSSDGYALTATEVIGSIMRQGLVHPKEVVSSLVALESSSNTLISQIAIREHRTLHSKHETIVERGYMDGVRFCYEYQCSVEDALNNASKKPAQHVAKLRHLYDIVKDGSRKVKKKLLLNLTKSIDFELLQLDAKHLDYAKFVIENLAFFEYATVEDVYDVVAAMERVVQGTGTTVAHAIEVELLFIKIDNEQDPTDRVIDPQKLKFYSAGAAILSMLWSARSYLRKAYGVNDAKFKDFKLKKIKATDASMNKAPTKNPSVSAAALSVDISETMTALGNDGGRMAQCQEFVNILNIDTDFKNAAEADENEEIGVGAVDTPEASGDEGSQPATPSSKARKRKGSAEVSEKPVKRRKPSGGKRKKSKERDDYM